MLGLTSLLNYLQQSQCSDLPVLTQSIHPMTNPVLPHECTHYCLVLFHLVKALKTGPVSYAQLVLLTATVSKLGSDLLECFTHSWVHQLQPKILIQQVSSEAQSLPPYEPRW